MRKRNSLILGTRGSKLAVTQTTIVQRRLETLYPSLLIEQKIISSTGDHYSTIPLQQLTKAQGEGLFTQQLTEALLSGEIDLAVHSLKDLPVAIQEGLELPAILPRSTTDDLLISRHPGGFSTLPFGATIGTSSPRRAFLIQSRRPDLQIIPLRGNILTRLEKVAIDHLCDATVLAAAGLERLGYNLSKKQLRINNLPLALETLDWMLPAPGQGAIAVMTRVGDHASTLAVMMHHEITGRCVEAERLVLKHLGGGCHLALGALAKEDRGILLLNAIFISEQNASFLIRSGKSSGTIPSDVARRVADQLLSH